MVVPAAGSGTKVRVQGSSSCYRHPLPTSNTRRGRHRCGSRVRDTARSPRGSACSLRDGRPRSFVRGTAPPRPASDGSRCRGAAHSGRRQSRGRGNRSEEHTSELQSRRDLVCRLLLEKKKKKNKQNKIKKNNK